MLWQPTQQASEYWPRAIILIDMNAFFASVEQWDHPEWRGRALAVTGAARFHCTLTLGSEEPSRKIAIKYRLWLPLLFLALTAANGI